MPALLRARSRKVVVQMPTGGGATGARNFIPSPKELQMRRITSSLRAALCSTAFAGMALFAGGCESLDQTNNKLDEMSASVNDSVSQFNQEKDEVNQSIADTQGSVEEAGASIEGTVDETVQGVEDATEVPEIPEIDLGSDGGR